MITAKGKSVSGGIAIGPVRWHWGEERIAAAEWAEDRERELIRLEKARNAAVLRQQGLYERSLKELGKGTAEVFAAHIMMLEDIDLLTAVRREIKEQRHTAEYAVQEAFEAQAKRLSGLDDDYMGERARDVIEMQKELMTALRGDSPGYLWNEAGGEDPEKPAILLAEDFMPSDVIRLDRSSLLGMVTREGTQNSHTAILARTMGVPMLVQCGEIGETWDGHCAVLDADAGIVYLDPDRAV
ncbi:phosphotransferase system enzyme I (PtsI) [Moryella indoligenes]|uniref:Phosphoenolpyruvate-protein phosphotransferase n=1 Tax=Moryella indoligenes TaxID=371674 RepID=A0AAE3V998_9FIRM|nr:phosphoenolpyruvate-utilizing N-terminal domain-containing protein [Moryella indoligenes]MDQ0151670.1 phosphotransferase system enzyme I (PtsI) [Moryella indoligenes]